MDCFNVGVFSGALGGPLSSVAMNNFLLFDDTAVHSRELHVDFTADRPNLKSFRQSLGFGSCAGTLRRDSRQSPAAGGPHLRAGWLRPRRNAPEFSDIYTGNPVEQDGC